MARLVRGPVNSLALSETLVINDVVFAELANGFDRFEDLQATVDGMGLALRPIPRAALFLAG